MTDVAKEVMTTKVTSVVEINNRVHATVRVRIEDGHIKDIRIGYSESQSPGLWVRDTYASNPLAALIELRNQLNDVIKECQIYVDPRIVVDKDSPIAGKLP